MQQLVMPLQHLADLAHRCAHTLEALADARGDGVGSTKPKPWALALWLWAW